jgi:hypothetical protein
MKETFKKVGKVVVLGVLVTAPAFADANLEAPTFNIDDIVLVAGALLTGLAAFWGINKALALAGLYSDKRRRGCY